MLKLEREREAANLEGYFVDIEYNRNDGRLKTILNNQYKAISIRCDIILHSRGKIRGQDNLLAIEMKRSHHPPEERDSDRVRLCALTKKSFNDIWSADGKTLPEHVCGYVLGYYLELNSREERFLVETYSCGKLVAEKHVQF